jgi:glycosyltransferase involved in cell wall biosynthesis
MLGPGKLRIALIGTRGVPANYGGFETCVEEIGRRLAEKGHEVTVYCRESYYKERRGDYLGMRLVHLPNLKNKSLDTMSHTLLSVWHALFRDFDVYAVFNAANSLFVLPLRIMGKKIVINPDGLEWKRTKWGFFGRTFYRISEKVAALIANRLVSDSPGIREHCRKVHHTDSTEIAYGAYVQNTEPGAALTEMGLQKGGYFLQITRFEPENHPLVTIRAFKRLNTGKKLVLVGGNPYPTEYTRQIAKEAGDGVVLPGFIYDKERLDELWCNCFAYVHGNSVGGTNPALLQAMACGNLVMAFDNGFNRDVLTDCGVYYSANERSLASKMQWALDNEGKLKEFSRKAQKRIEETYSWDKIADEYERVFLDVHEGKYPWRFNWRVFLPQSVKN